MCERMEKGWEERVKQLNKRGRRQEWDTICQKTMEQSRTNKSLQCCFLYLIYSQLSRPNNEGWSLLMLTARDNFGLQLHPKRLEDGQISLVLSASLTRTATMWKATLNQITCLPLFNEVMWRQVVFAVYSSFILHLLWWGANKKCLQFKKKNVVFNVQKFFSIFDCLHVTD